MMDAGNNITGFKKPVMQGTSTWLESQISIFFVIPKFNAVPVTKRRKSIGAFDNPLTCKKILPDKFLKNCIQ